MNSLLKSLKCIRCGSKYKVKDYYRGCPRCGEAGFPSSLVPEYDSSHVTQASELFSLLPYEAGGMPALGEGNTPHIRLNAKELESNDHEIWVKNEGSNPTGSHKDRMSPYVMARAKEIGAKTIVAASSGNAAISLACYAAAANLDCKIISTLELNTDLIKALALTGAQVILEKDAMARWHRMAYHVEQDGWYPATNFCSPPVGSNLFGVEGYKKVAYEMIRDFMDKMPDYIIIPSSRGDLIWGVFSGFREAVELQLIKQIPKLIAVEPFSRLDQVVNRNRSYVESFGVGISTALKSIGGTTVTYQLYKAVVDSAGSVEIVNSEEARLGQSLFMKQGIYTEVSSAAVFIAAKRLVKKVKNKRILMVATSHGFKTI